MGTVKPQLPPIPKENKFKQALGLGVGIWDYFDAKEKEIGETYTLTFPGQGPMVWTSDPAMILDILKLQREQIDGSLVQLPFDLGESNLVFSNDEAHHESRKLAIPQFAGGVLQGRAQMMYEIVSEHINSWKVGQLLDAPRMVGDMTMDITCATLFNLREGARKDRYKELMLAWIQEANSNTNFTIASIVGASRFRKFLNKQYIVRSENNVMGDGSKGFFPWKRGIDLKVQLGAMIREDVRNARKYSDDSETHTLAVYARARDAHGQLMDEEKVISEIYGFMIGGHETSAATAAWFMIWLLKKPDIFRKIKEEVLAFIERERMHDPLLASELPYLTACLNESQRITPSAPGYIRWLRQDTKVGKWHLPAGTAVLPNIYSTHRRKDIYGDDALEYNPARWTKPDGSPRAFKPNEFMPFGGGRRACIGMSQARQQLRIIFSELARRVEFSSPLQAINGLPRSRLLGGQVEPLEGVPMTVSVIRPQNYGYPEVNSSEVMPKVVAN